MIKKTEPSERQVVAVVRAWVLGLFVCCVCFMPGLLLLDIGYAKNIGWLKCWSPLFIFWGGIIYRWILENKSWG